MATRKNKDLSVRRLQKESEDAVYAAVFIISYLDPTPTDRIRLMHQDIKPDVT